MRRALPLALILALGCSTEDPPADVMDTGVTNPAVDTGPMPTDSGQPDAGMDAMTSTSADTGPMGMDVPAPDAEPITPYDIPIFSAADGVFSCFYVRGIFEVGLLVAPPAALPPPPAGAFAPS